MAKFDDVKFWRCKHCGNLFYTLVDGGVTPECCGEPMELLKADSTDAATEKHVPSITHEGDRIIAHIGTVDHPMIDEHWIEFVALVADGEIQVKWLNPGEAPEVEFQAKGVESGTIYEFCNIHGLWKKDFQF